MRRVERVTRYTCTVLRFFEKNYQPFVRDPPFLVPIRYPSYVPPCIEFSNRHAVLLSNHIFVAPSPQRLPNRPLNLRSFLINRFSQLTQPSTRRAAFHMYVHTHVHNHFRMRFPPCIVPLFFSLFPTIIHVYTNLETRIHQPGIWISRMCAKDVYTCQVPRFNNSLR